VDEPLKRSVGLLVLVPMRDNHSGMPEIMDAFERSEHYFAAIKISLAETYKQFEFGVSREGYRALKKILQLRPFDSMPGVHRKFFFVAKYGKLPNGPNYRGYVRVEQGRDGKELEVNLPKDLLANLVWFSQIKDFGEALHLPEIKNAP
jgi:hypothetical protein